MKELGRLTCCAILLSLFNVFSTPGSAGETWYRQKSGTLAWLHAVYFLNANRGWAAGGNGALLSTIDGGAGWKTLRRPCEDSLQDIFFSDERTGWVLCERSVYLLKTNDEPRSYLMKTSDGGATWVRVNVVGSDVDARLVRFLFARGGNAWAFGEGGALYSTRDYGATWSRQTVPTSHLLLGGTFVDGEEGWIVGAGGAMLQTSNGGETWRNTRNPQMAGVRFSAAAYADRLHLWVVGNEGRIYASTDAGRTWHAQTSNTSSDLLDVIFPTVSEGWAVGKEGTIIHTIDGGAHWSPEQSGTTHPLERLSFSGPNRGWAVGFGGIILAEALGN